MGTARYGARSQSTTRCEPTAPKLSIAANPQIAMQVTQKEFVAGFDNVYKAGLMWLSKLPPGQQQLV